ncbi:HAMP domain-containing sensor histidine kinase [Nodosilinea sp. E11]|uniref:sensor histidine kinase n=1 Tax=Nodosilinea sp. E11 TaxID=3037479 RepID=UPI0029342473|nr:HAMP domain-containing sensor histidine kinase [Nodosilinea sp. E11]WOD40957.1 HAMP domain-containing sensor histidine kinase [Nodosilinea sp. E11]
MASDNSPVLFQARPPEGLSLAASTHGDGREIWPLVHALAATLNDPNPLPALTEVLGTHLGARACLMLCHYPSTSGVTYTCWHQGTAPASHWLAASSDPSTVLDGQRRVTLELIQQTIAPPMGLGWPHWRKGLAELLQADHRPPAWLRAIATATAIAVDGSGLQGAILLLGTSSLGLDQTVQANLASLGAIAFHQYYLQGQAQGNAEQVLYLNHLKEDFLSTLSHELRTPLTSMMLAIRMLRRPDLTPERSAMYLDILEQQCTREINLVNDLLMLQTLESTPPLTTPQPIDLSHLLTDLAQQAKEPFQQAQLTLAQQLPPTPVTLSIDSAQLTKVLQELLANARKYSAPQTTVTLALADNQAHQGRITLQISNVGAAIGADDLPHIFDKFRRGCNATKDGIAGTGAGLALVHGIVEQLGGTIKVSSQPHDNQLWQTCFTLEFEHHDKSIHNS